MSQVDIKGGDDYLARAPTSIGSAILSSTPRPQIRQFTEQPLRQPELNEESQGDA
jgi:hypothetical protein